MHILIVKASAFGDILHALPVLPVLHGLFPGIQIDWVVEEPFAELLAGNPLITRLMVISTKRWRRSLGKGCTYHEVGAVIKKLRTVRYAMVIDLQGNLKSGIVTALARAEDKVGFEYPQLQERINTLFTRRQITMPDGLSHISDQYLALATAALGSSRPIKPPENICLFPSAQQLHEASLLLADTAGHFVVAIHQGTTWQTKYWDIESWVALIRLLQNTIVGVRVVLTCGSDAEYQMAQQTRDAVGDAVQIVSRTPIMVLAALYQQVDLVMGGDTGPLHLAAAVGTPTCSLYRSSDGLRSGPRGERHAIVQVPMVCSPCFKTSCSDDALCRSTLTPDLVFEHLWRHITKNNLIHSKKELA